MNLRRDEKTICGNGYRECTCRVAESAPLEVRQTDLPMPEPADEIHLIQTFSDTKVIGLTINHENMTDADVSAAIARYQDQLGIPVTDPLTRPPRMLVEMVLSAFPL